MSIQNLLSDKLNLIYKLYDPHYRKKKVINNTYIEIYFKYFNDRCVRIYFCNNDISTNFEIFMPHQICENFAQERQIKMLEQYLIDRNIINEFLLMLDKMIIDII